MVIGLFLLVLIYNWVTIVNAFGTHSPPMSTGVIHGGLVLWLGPCGSAMVKSPATAVRGSARHVPSGVFLIEPCAL